MIAAESLVPHARFSIFIPVRNDTVWLPGAIRSVVRQTYPHWELIIGDNDSTEDIAAVVAEFADPRIRYHRWTTGTDIFENFNRTALLSQFEWVQFLGADDRLHPTCLHHMAEVISSAPKDRRLAMVLAACRRLTPEGGPADRIWYGSKPRVPVDPGIHNPEAWFHVMTSDGNPPWNVGSVAVARSVIEESGGYFRPEVGLSSDIEMEMRVGAYGDVIYIDKPLLNFTVRPDSDGSKRLGLNRARGDTRTVIGAALLAGLSVHEHRRQVSRQERRRVYSTIARSHLQRAAQHRIFPAGKGRRGALRDVWRAFVTRPLTTLAPYNLAYAMAAVLAPASLLRLAQRVLSARHSG